MTAARAQRAQATAGASDSTTRAKRRAAVRLGPVRTPGAGDFHLPCGGTWTWSKRLRRLVCTLCGEAKPVVELLARRGEEWIYIRPQDALRAAR